MVHNLIDIIYKLRIPKVILRFIMMNFLDFKTIKNLLFTVKEMNVLDSYSKDLLIKAKKGFIYNCLDGHLTVAKWLYSIDEVNIHYNNEQAFRWSCGYGHLAVAQWLYSLGEVNIHADNECAFRWSCDAGHLTVAQWLYSLGNVNIHADNEYVFKCAYSFKYIKLA